MYYRKPLATKDMRYTRLSRRVKNMSILLKFWNSPGVDSRYLSQISLKLYGSCLLCHFGIFLCNYGVDVSVILLPLGRLRQYVNDEKELILEGKEGKSIAVVCKEIGIPISIGTVFIVNDKQKSKEYILQPDDVVKLIGLSGGG